MLASYVDQVAPVVTALRSFVVKPVMAALPMSVKAFVVEVEAAPPNLTNSAMNAPTNNGFFMVVSSRLVSAAAVHRKCRGDSDTHDPSIAR